jgi:hypothetical protein
MTNVDINNIRNESKSSLYYNNSAIENSIGSALSFVEPSLPLQPSPPSDYEEYLLKCEQVVLFLFFFIIILHHFFLLSLVMLLVVFLSIYQSRTIHPIATTTIIMIPAQNNKLLIPSTSPAVAGSNGYYCKAHSLNWPSASSPVNV